ncbi:MAG TPA: YidC/Oxa1 family membrane protein insertase [Nitrolancea sp.]|nr:YidC/Oxa1 family membrane protein insertase [Nitrolancea sp.]
MLPILSSIPVWNQFVHAIEAALRFTADFTGSAGIAVIVLTIIFKTILLPLTVKSLRSMSSMQELQPKIKDLQKKYAKDRQKLSAETMKLYQEHGVNPASGCLPMLLQVPIFFGLYFAIRNLSAHGGGIWNDPFLWLPSLAKPDPYHILPIAAGLFQFVQTRMARPRNQGKAADPQQQMMNTMMTFTPLMVVIFGWAFDSGPVIYWTVSAIYSAVQQWFITGWGSMLDWFPWLPDLPEHRRLGYETPEKKAKRREQAGQQKGLFGMLNKQIQQQVQKVDEQHADSDESGDESAPAAPRPKATKTRASNGRATVTPPRPAPSPDLVPRRSRGGKSKRSPKES